MPRQRKELWEDLVVVWQELTPPDWVWHVTKVTNHHASEDLSAPKCITGNELISSAWKIGAVKAGSKQEAIMKYIMLSGWTGDIWSVVEKPVVYRFLSPMPGGRSSYTLTKEM